MSWNGTVRCSICYKSGHNKSGCPQVAEDYEEYKNLIAKYNAAHPDKPDIEIDHVVTPTQDSELGAKGAGEAGTIGAMPCVMNAAIDALSSLGISQLDMPLTPGRVWQAIQSTG